MFRQSRLVLTLGVIAFVAGLRSPDTVRGQEGRGAEGRGQEGRGGGGRGPARVDNPLAGPTMPRAEVERMIKDLSNWGRWGKDDQRGTINLITPARRKEAAGLVKTGVSVSLSFNPPTERAVDNTAPFELTMGGNAGGGVVLDTWKVSHHGFTFTHLDALCHWFFQGTMYNGFEPSEVTPQGCRKGGMEQIKEGILTRGILVDIPRLKNVPYLEPGAPIMRADIEAWEKRARVKIGPGDVVLVRTGRWAKRAALGPFSIQGNSAGVHISGRAALQGPGHRPCRQ